MTTATINVDALITRLQAHLASLGDGRDARSENEKATYHAAYNLAQRTLSELRDAPSNLGRAQAELTDVETRRAAHLAKQAELEQELASAPAFDTFADARERDKEYVRQRDLRMSLQLLRNGGLFKAPGVSYESLAYLDTRIAELTERRDRAQRALDGYIAQAEALLAAVPVTT